MRTRFGVRLTRQQATILNKIEERGVIDIETLGWILYPGVAESKQKNRISVLVCQINDLLVSTDWHIVNVRPYSCHGALYQLAETKSEAA